MDALELFQKYTQLGDDIKNVIADINSLKNDMSMDGYIEISDNIYSEIETLAKSNNIVGIAKIFNDIHDITDYKFRPYELGKLEGWLSLRFPDVWDELLDKQNNQSDEDYAKWINS